jgi:hypothetical protein
MSTTADELDAVLSRISGAELYRGNAFRITGLSPAATSAGIRRAREEAVLASRLGTALPVGEGGLALDPPPGTETIRTAFETMSDPVARLIHELLWFSTGHAASWPGADAHERAVRDHCEAVEAEYAGPHQPGSAEARRLDELWKRSLAAWAGLLVDHGFWDHAKERARQIDDPRLTTGTVRRLRERLPRHIALVTAGLALRAVRLGEPAAARLVALLNESPLPEEAVDFALRETVRPAERAVRAACIAARNTVRQDGSTAAATGDEVLARTAEHLEVVRALCGADGVLMDALSDEVALVVNECAVIHDQVTERPGPALGLLARGAGLARIPRTRDLIQKNSSVLRQNALMGPLNAMCRKGKLERAARHLRALVRYASDDGLSAAAKEKAKDSRGLTASVGNPPSNTITPVIGSLLVGRRARNEQGRFISTSMLTVLFIPLIPIAAFEVDDLRVYARVPLSTFTRWWRRFVLTALVVLPVHAFAPAPYDWIGVVAVLGFVVGRLGLLQLRLRVWARQQVAR